MSLQKFSRLGWVLIVASVLEPWVTLKGQESRGSIAGQVHDPSGAVVPGAEVIATNLATGVKLLGKSNTDGQYTCLFVLPGMYRVSVSAKGFKLSERDNIEVRVHDRLQVDFSLEVGAVTDEVRVTAEVPLLQTANANLGQVMDTRRVAELPIQHGSPLSLIYLAPGVLDVYTAGNMRQSTDALQTILATGLSINGSGGNTADYTIDGIPNTQTNWGNSVLNSPPIDAVQEFKVETAFDASQGHTSGVIMNFSLKTGTNQLHGTAYGFLREPSWNANDFWSNKYGQPRADFTYERWGVSSTGPIYIPGIYNGKNRTFYSYAFEHYDIGSPDPFLGTVPTAKQVNGDFSALLAVGPQYQIYDPSTIKPAGNGRFSIQPFPGNIIPANRINPVAKALLAHFPAPNAAGTADGLNNYSNPNYKSPELYYNHILRLDHNLSTKQRVYARITQNQNKQGPYRKWWNDPAVGQNFVGTGPQISLDDVYTITPTLVANIRYGFIRFNAGSKPDRLGYDIRNLGFSQQFINQVDPQWAALPTVSISGLARLGGESFNSSIDNVHALFGSVTKQKGAHELGMGVDLRAYRKNSFTPGAAAGSFTFDSTYTRGPLDNSATSPSGLGQGLAAFLLGIPTTGSIAFNDSQASQSTYTALYFQDNWRASSRLTLNLGLRWEYEGPTRERYDRSVRSFDPTAAQPIEAQAKAQYAINPDPSLPVSRFQVRGGLLFAGVNGQPDALWNRSHGMVAPRFGFAYQVSAKTVVRGGFGIYPIQIGVPGGNFAIQSGYSQTTTLVPSLDNGQTFIASLANPFPGGVLPPAGSRQGIQTFLGKGVSFYVPNAKRPYASRWALNTQRLLPGQFLVEVGYVGSKSIKLQIVRDFDALPDQYLSRSPFRDPATINYLTANVANPLAGLLPGTSRNGATIPRAVLLTPYPQFTGVTAADYQGYSWYHAMQSRMERRFSHGFTAQVAYTFSKTMDATSYLNPGDPLPYRVISAADRPHHLTFSGIFEAPLGRGKAIWGSANNVANAVVGGWEIAPVFQLRSGYAYGFGNALFLGNVKNIPLSNSQRTLDRWFNTDAGFVKDPAQQLQSNLVTFPTRFSGLRTGGSNLWDLSVIKKTRIKERHEIQFRAEFFNLLNHLTELAPPVTDPTSSAFGQVTDSGALPRNIQLGLKYVF